MSLPDQGVPQVPLELISSGVNHWTATAKFPYDGTWKIEFIVDVGDGSTLMFSTTADIAKQ
jgi:hypothetical protein